MEPESPPSAAARARAADAAAAALEEAPSGGDAATTRSPFKRLASRTLSDRWVQELQASPNDLVRARRSLCAVRAALRARALSDSRLACSLHARPRRAAQAAREAKSIHFDAGGAGGDGQADDLAAQHDDMAHCLSPADAAPASPAHAERSGASRFVPRRTPGASVSCPVVGCAIYPLRRMFDSRSRACVALHCAALQRLCRCCCRAA